MNAINKAPTFGEAPDWVVAKALGYSEAYVRLMRRLLGIPSWREARSAAVDWDAVGLGERPDVEIAKEAGFSAGKVRMERVKRGITAYGQRWRPRTPKKPVPRIEPMPIDEMLNVSSMDLVLEAVRRVSQDPTVAHCQTQAVVALVKGRLRRSSVNTNLGQLRRSGRITWDLEALEEGRSLQRVRMEVIDEGRAAA